MRHQAAHDKRREPIDPKFRHRAEGVACKRVVKSAEIADARARDRNHGGPREVTAFEAGNERAEMLDKKASRSSRFATESG